MPGRKVKRQRPGGPLAYIAFWQFMAFLLLVSLIWADAVLDLPNLLFRLPEGRFNWYRACVLTAAVIVVGFVSIGHAYVQQKRALKGLIKICSYCRRVQVDEQAWRRMEDFIETRTLAEFTHGVCPECYQRALEGLSGPPPGAPPPESTLDRGPSSP
ncbi:MAG TPA: hypothetical protein P5567_03970 [Kiritimatiellia bacterium]|nr:hypothetical protein [Kiritimatiellia bacterium]HRZ11594.1 hypothetical protein [Kiritimatiellia bacterium]HSA16855.1 hypothetical protein [Kiritimatiellia bacterium]